MKIALAGQQELLLKKKEEMTTVTRKTMTFSLGMWGLFWNQEVLSGYVVTSCT